MKRFAAIALLLVSCRAEVRKDAIHGREQLDTNALRGVVVEASAPASPSWIDSPNREAPGELAFVGRAEAPGLDAAKSLALKDLYASISSFVAVDVESSHEDHTSSGTRTGEEQRITEKLKTRSSASLREINPDQHYWERAVASPLTPTDTRYRYWVHAWVPRAEIARARIQRQRERETETNKKSVAIVPFSAPGAEDAQARALAGGLAEDLGKLLASRPGIHVGDPAIVRAVLPAGGSEMEILERVQDALLPDVVITGAFRRDGDRVKVTAVAYDGREGKALRTRALERPFREVRALERSLAQALAADLGVAAPAAVKDQPAPAPQDTDVEAFEAYHDAYRLFQSGANEKALERIRRAIALRPSDPAAYLRLGRILERMGRYARLPPGGAGGQTVDSPLDAPLCTQAAREQSVRALTFLRERAAKLRGPARPKQMGAPWWSDDTLAVDVLLMTIVKLGLSDVGRAGDAPESGDLVTSTMELPLRGGPGMGSYVVGAMPAGAQMVVHAVSPDGEWLFVQDLSHYRSGWVPAGAVRRTGARAGGYGQAAQHSAQSLRRGLRSTSAAEAYFEARLLFQEADDPRGAMEATLALADLGVRVDRLDEAHSLYLEVEERASRVNDAHFLSLARAGDAAALRQAGDLASARAKLLSALYARLVLGEKPYLLELYNALGGLAVDLGEYAEAERWYRRAQRIAGELGIDYLKAVLANNVGVLEHNLGRSAQALDHVEEAFARLASFGEAEGRIASGLNAAYLRHLRGDPAGGAAALDATAHLVEETAQDGRLAELAAKRGALAASRGDTGEAAYQLALSYFLFRVLARPVQIARLQNDLLATELASIRDLPDDETLECLKRTYWETGTPVFVAPRSDPSTPTLATAPTEMFQDHELVTALNAASLSALSAWRPDLQYVLRRRPHRTLIDKRRPPPPPMPAHDYELEVLRQRPTSRESLPEPSSTEDTVYVTEAEEGFSIGGSADEEPPQQPLVSEKPAEYERILGAFLTDADVFVWLDPLLTGEMLDRRASAIAQRMLFAAARHFEKREAPRPRAIALLNLGALEWFSNRPVSAYEHVMEAQRTFAELGDVEGLAHAYEWLGWFFQESGDAALAAEHLALSHALYRRLDDTGSVERVLSYGSGD